MGVSVRDKRGEWDRMKKQLAALQGTQIRVGVMGAEASTPHENAQFDQRRQARARGGKLDTVGAAAKGLSGSTLTIAEIATRNEFGLGIPQRSFLRGWMAEDEDKIRRVLMAACREALKGRDAKQAMDRAGAKYVGMVQVRIAQGIDPPNSAYTIRLKGSSTPLIDTGVLRSSITWLTVRV